MKKELVLKFLKLEPTFLALNQQICEELYQMISIIKNGIIDYVTNIDYLEEFGKLVVYYCHDDSGTMNIEIPIDWLSNPDWHKEYEKSLMYEEEQKKLNEKLKVEEEEREYQLYLKLKDKFKDKK